MSKVAASGSPPASDADTIRKLNQIINLIDCPKDLNDSGVEVWGNSGTSQRNTIEDNLAIMIAQLFVRPDSNSGNAMTRINAVFGGNNHYKVIGDDKPKMNDIISNDEIIKQDSYNTFNI